MGLVRRTAALALLSTLLLSSALLGAERADGRENRGEPAPEAPEEWTENLFSFEPMRIDSSVLEHQIQITVHRWGSFTEPQRFKLAVEAKPAFMKKAWWAEGETIEFTPDETEKTVNLRFTLAEAGNARGNLVFRIAVEDAAEEQEDILPRVRRFELPFGFGRERGEGCAYALKDNAPDTIEPNELHKWVDLESEPLYACDDRVAVFFTPAIDLKAENVAFRWFVLPPRSEQKQERDKQDEESVTPVDGSIYEPGGWMHRELGINPFPNVLGKFIVELRRGGDSRGCWDTNAGWASGRFRVETAAEKKSESSLFGVQGSVPGEYVEVAAFEFTPLPELQLVGLRTGPPQNANLGALPWCYDGTLQMRATGSGHTLHLDIEARYRRISRDDKTAPEPDQHQASFKARIELPETLRLDQRIMGEGKVICEEYSHGRPYTDFPYGAPVTRAFAGLGGLVAVGDRLPDDWLFFGEDLALGRILIPDGPSTTLFDGCPFDDSEVLLTRIPERDTWTYQVTSWGIGESGSPKRKLGFHLRNSATVFVLPIRFSFPTRADDPRTYEVFSYAIYKAKGS